MRSPKFTSYSPSSSRIMNSISLFLSAAITVSFIMRYVLVKKHKLPPGPPEDPLIGHLRSIPSSGQDMFFYDMGKKYGDVIRLSVLGKTIIVLNSVQAASDLLDKRGSNYSDRPTFPIFNIIGETLPFMTYGDEFRTQRRMVQQYFSKDKIKSFHRMLIREAHTLALSLVSSPSEDFVETIVRFSASVIIDLTYGHQVVTDSDPYVRIAADCGEALAMSGPPGGTLVDLFPILRHFPSWFPGAYYAGVAREASLKFQKIFEYPYYTFLEQIANGTAKPSFIASLFDDLRQREMENDETSIKRVQSLSSITYFGGADTTSSTLSFFVMAMVLHPGCMIKAQEEIDRVIGLDRLPEFGDRNDLPYLECIVQETLRWNHAVPSGAPHMAAKDDEYNGMFIPKGATVIANTRSMTLDESVYKNPFNFEPERFLPAPVGRGEPYAKAVFGFGRRRCPGRHLANDSLWMAIATIISTMSIYREIGRDGKEILPDIRIVVEGITNHPSNFPCRFLPRCHAMKMLQASVDSA